MMTDLYASIMRDDEDDFYHSWHAHLNFPLTFLPFSSPQSAGIYLYLLLHE